MARNLGASPPVADELADDGWTLSDALLLLFQ
jgi:hypothetical protein